MEPTRSLDTLAACLGRWRGTNRLHDPHTNSPEDSPSTVTVASVLDGRFLRLDYDWGYQGASQAGTMLIGADPDAGEITASWADTWHMGHKVMACRGAADNPGRLVVLGSYSFPPGPDWGWRIELLAEAGRSLRIVMFNLTPEGQASPAVEASYTPDMGLSEIGQIAVTVSDVGQALAFYRDVLGLRFLFSAGPNLAFLAAGNVRLMLTLAEGAGKAGTNSIFYYRVKDVEAVHAAIVSRGAANERAPQLTARMPDHELWIGFVRDPDGNLVGLMEEKRPAS